MWLVFATVLFSFQLRADSIKITAPIGEVHWLVGEYHLITWTGVAKDIFVRIELSTNNGSTWSTITDSASNGSYLWKVTDIMSSSCLLRVSAPLVTSSVIILKGHAGFVNTASFSKDGILCATGSDDASAKIWNAHTGELLRTITGHTSDVMYTAISPDNTKILTCSQDGTAKIWDLATGALLHTLYGHTLGLVYGEFSPDGLLVSTSSDDGTAKIWDANTGQLLETLLGYEGFSGRGLYCAFFSPDGKFVATAGRDSTARIFDIATGRLVQKIKHNNVVHWACWNSDMTLFATACRDNNAYVFDTDSYTVKGVLHGHVDWVWSVEFSRDGTQILTGGRDGYFRVWNAQNYACTKTMYVCNSDVGAARFSPTADRILTGSNDNLGRIFFLDLSNTPRTTDVSASPFVINNSATSGVAYSAEELGLTVYPNPSSSELLIRLPVEFVAISIDIVDELGLVAKHISSSVAGSQSESCLHLDVSGWPNGAYTVVISGNSASKYSIRTHVVVLH